MLEPYTAPTEFDEQGQRVVEGQRLTQAASDIFLGWLSATGPDGKKRDFYVRQLWDQKASAQVELMSPAAMTAYAQICGAILARAHARTGDRIAIAAYLGGGSRFDEAIADFADCVRRPERGRLPGPPAAAEDGRITIEAEPGLGARTRCYQHSPSGPVGRRRRRRSPERWSILPAMREESTEQALGRGLSEGNASRPKRLLPRPSRSTR